MSEPPFTLRLLATSKDDPNDRKYVTVTYDEPVEEDFAKREAERYLAEHDLVRVEEVETPDISDVTSMPWDKDKLEAWRAARKKARDDERDQARSARRKMGEDCNITRFDGDDFNLGPELEELIEPANNDKPESTYHNRAEAVFQVLRDCFDTMRTEGEWDWIAYDYDDEKTNSFAWRPDLWSDFWDGEFPFTLDLRPGDIKAAVLQAIRHETETEGGEHYLYEDDMETIGIFRNKIREWHAAFDDALAALDEHVSKCQRCRREDADSTVRQDGPGIPMTRVPWRQS